MSVPLENKLPNFGDKYIQIFDSRSKAVHIRRRSRAEGSLSLLETMELAAKLLRRYQSTYWPHENNANLIWFPFLFKQPAIGASIINDSTGEIYTVDQIVVNKATGQWDGLVRLNLVNQPSAIKRQSLTFLEKDNYVRFDHETPEALPNLVGANEEGRLENAPPMEPTVTWNIERAEPAGQGQAFGSKKEFRPRERELVKDPLEPGYSVKILGQYFDNLVQFDCWTHDSRSSEKLYIWFEQFLNLYRWVFRKLGVAQLFFWERLQDRTSTSWRQYYPVRTMRWYFRTETLSAEYQRDILKLDVNIDIGEAAPNLDVEGRWIADQFVSGKLTLQEYRDLFYRSGEYLFGDVTLNV